MNTKRKPSDVQALGMLEGALQYAARGLPVFPCLANERKKPLTKNGFKDATTDPATIQRWWRKNSTALIGIPMGWASGFFCVDLDRKPPPPGEQMKDGVKTWAEWEAEHGKTETLSAETPSGGQHRIFKYREGVRNIGLDKLGPGIEIKGEGGYIIVAPSRIPGYRSENYRWLNDAPIAEAPDWLLEKIFAERAPERKPRATVLGGLRPNPPERCPLPASLLALLKRDAGKGLSNDPEDTMQGEAERATRVIPNDDVE
jgi:hypothetical protein